MNEIRIDKFIEICGKLNSEMTVEYRAVAPTLEFSNTGRRGTKYFSVTLVQLKKTLSDILENFDHFLAHREYEESPWRALFSTYISDAVVNALSTVQTLPLYTVINKVLTVANNVSSYTDKSMPLTRDNLERAIEYLASQLPDNDAYLLSLSSEQSSMVNEPQSPYSVALRKQGAKNLIFYGAPGTGKSYSVAQQTNEQNAIRTVFHPDTQYSDFVGCLKPVMLDGNSVGYGFRAGPFTAAVIKAVNNPDQMISLVIEELNRAPAAAVFGEIFQLLDRDVDGSSTYPIDISDPDMLAYLNSRTQNAFPSGKLKLPPNLSLLATMNSSDQAVMPLDTAFKRRWEFKYLPIDYGKASSGTLNIPVADGRLIKVKWADFARVINERLSAQRIPEDRLLGHRFISETELNESADDVLKGKLFMYLWDDVLRHGRQGIVFTDSVAEGSLTTFGQLADAFENRQAVFNHAVQAELVRYALSETSDED